MGEGEEYAFHAHKGSENHSTLTGETIKGLVALRTLHDEPSQTDIPLTDLRPDTETDVRRHHPDRPSQTDTTLTGLHRPTSP